MITDVLTPELERRFAGTGVHLREKPGIVAVFPAAHPDVGNVTISDDGDEATIFIEHITHLHINPYDNTLPEAERDRLIAEDVIGFMEDLLADRVLLWVSKTSRSGGCRNIHDGIKPEYIEARNRYFLWSGPLKTETTGDRPTNKRTVP